MTKFMTLIAGAALTAATAAPALANDPFVSTQNGSENTGLTTSTVAPLAAATLALGLAVLNDGSSSSSSSSSSSTTGSGN